MGYKLVYHAGIPGRGEFVRLVFEATGTPYEDVAHTVGQKGILPYLKGDFKGSETNPTPFAPPILVVDDSTVIHQTANALLYLSLRLPKIDLEAAVTSDEGGEDSKEGKGKKQKLAPAFTGDDTTLFHVNEIVMTIMDLVNEVHDTHHPINMADYYDNQKEAALERTKPFRDQRVPKYLKYFESAIAKTQEQQFLTSEGATVADLALYQVIDGISFAFPKLIAKLSPKYPLTFALYDRVKESPRIKSYLESDRRFEYSQGIFRHYPELDEADD
ncbi:hypothetical protein T439DRAFT_309082 [Meredithblackwellia eburnea MCA 4105]